MTYLTIYLLIGLIVAVWTAINQVASGDDWPEADTRGASSPQLPIAYVLVALAWPLSLAVMIYAVAKGLMRELNNKPAEPK